MLTQGKEALRPCVWGEMGARAGWRGEPVLPTDSYEATWSLALVWSR
jgi:hypothetical protein